MSADAAFEAFLLCVGGVLAKLAAREHEQQALRFLLLP